MTQTLSTMKFSRRLLLGGVATALAISALVGAAPTLSAQDAAAGEPVPGGILKMAFAADPAGFDPAKGGSGMSSVVNQQIYSTLMELDPDGNPIPNLAESYEISEDGLSYTFKLYPGITFHNGEELTADDIKFTFDRLMDPATGYNYKAQIETINEVVVEDPLTVTFKLSAPTGPMLIYLAFPGTSIVPQDLVESGHDLSSDPVGSGPFKFVSYQPRSMVKFEKFENYHEKGKPYLDGLEFRLIADITSLTNAVVSGTVDFSDEIPPKDWQTVTATPGIVGETTAGSRIYWLLPNNSKPPFDNAKVRQAFSMALDREAITAAAFFGQADPITGGTIPDWNWGYAGLDFVPSNGDPAAAKALLEEAGYPDGFDTSVTMASSFPAMIAMAPILQANMAAIGVNMEIKTVEVPRYWDEVWAPSNFDITGMYWLSPLSDPDDFTTNNYKCDMPVNRQQSCTEEMDELLSQAKTAVTKEERLALYKEQQELSMEQMPIVPVVNSYILTAYTDRLKNFIPTRAGSLKPIKDAWLTK